MYKVVSSQDNTDMLTEVAATKDEVIIFSDIHRNCHSKVDGLSFNGTWLFTVILNK